MRRLFLRILPLLALLGVMTPRVAGQQLTPSDYIFPLKGVAGYYSANFGEMRTNHFHSGIDFKTDGVEGKAVVAVADGWVSRIFLSPSGYGRALYITHPNGTTSVYGHLQRFTPEIERFVAEERLRTRSNRVDIPCGSARFLFRQGEEIGRSGNSGTSFGPHLHFEVRETATQRTLNTIAAGLYRPKDHIPPYIFRLHYVEVDTLRGVPVHAPCRTYEVEKVERERYRLKEEKPLPVGRNGYFVVEVSDRKDEVSNRYGVYRLQEFVDQELRVEYRMDGFSFDRTRYCNAVSFYPLQANSRNEVMRLVKMEGTPRDFYPTLVDRGVLSVEAGARHTLRLVAEDDCGNRSELRFQVVGKADAACFRARPDTLSPIIDRRYAFRHREDGLSVLIPRYALYESTLYHQRRLEQPLKADSSLVILSPLYRLLDATVPLHRPILVAIETFVPRELQKHVTLALRNRKGKLTALGGRYEQGAVEAEVSTLGDYFVAADTVAPTVRFPFASGADLRGKRSLTIRLSDNFSGIRHWAAYLDGAWIPFDYHPVRENATLALPDTLASGRHRLRILVTDPCGNTADRTIEFFR